MVCFTDALKEIGTELQGFKTIGKLLKPVAHAVRSLQWERMETADVAHIQFDFMDAFGEKYLVVVCCSITSDWRLFDDVLAVHLYRDRQFHNQIAVLVKHDIKKRLPRTTYMAAVQVDGALISAGEAVAGEGGDVLHCFDHRLALPVKASLQIRQGAAGPFSVAQVDFSFMQQVAIYVRSTKEEQRVLARLQRNAVGDASKAEIALLKVICGAATRCVRLFTWRHTCRTVWHGGNLSTAS